jgi:hypothetical protein
MSALSIDQIQELLAGSRARGDYDEVLSSFLKSEDMGIEVDLNNGPLAGKDNEKGSKNVVTGFKNAAKRMNDDGTPRHPGAHQVQVVLRKVGEGDDAKYHVFLINKGKLGGAEAATEQPAEAPVQ